MSKNQSVNNFLLVVNVMKEKGSHFHSLIIFNFWYELT